MTPLDLSTADVWLGNYSGGRIVPDPSSEHLYVHFPSVLLDPAATYTFEVDLQLAGFRMSSDWRLYSLQPTAEGAFDGSWHEFGTAAGSADVGGLLTLSVTIGPGLGEWDLAMSKGETRALLDMRYADLLAVRWDGTPVPVPDPEPVAVPRSGLGIVVESSEVVDVRPPLSPGVVTVPLHVVTPTVPKPTLVNGRPS